MAGQIINRGENTWLVRVFLGRGSEQKRKYLNKTIHGTKKDAQKWLTAKLREKDMGIAIEPSTSTVDEYLTRWLETVVKLKVRPKTFYGYAKLFDRYVRPALGNRALAKVTIPEIQDVYNKLQSEGLSPRTIQYTHMILKQAFQQAIRWRLIHFNPCDGAEVPRQQRREMKVLSPEEARRFIAAARMDKHAAVFELAITSGMRPSEYLALKWTDIDFTKAQASINRSLDWLPGGGWAFEENKTGKSRRVVKLHGSVVKGLKDWRAQQERYRETAGEQWTEYGLVFTTESGGPIDRHNLSRRNFKILLKTAGLPQIRLYDLRHTAATLALSAAVPVKVVSEQLGHASAALTLDVYSHVLPHMQDDAVRRVEELLVGEVPRGKARTKPDRRTIGTQTIN